MNSSYTPSEILIAQDARTQVLDRQVQRSERGKSLDLILQEATDGGDLMNRLSSLDYKLPEDFSSWDFEKMKDNVRELIAILLRTSPSISTKTDGEERELLSTEPTPPTPETTEASEQGVEKVGDSFIFHDKGLSIEAMKKEGLVLFDSYNLIIPSDLSLGATPHPASVTAPIQGTFNLPYTKQLDLLPSGETHTTFRELCALWLAAKNAGTLSDLPSCWLRSSTQGADGVRLIVKFGADGVSVYRSWDDSASPDIALASARNF